MGIADHGEQGVNRQRDDGRGVPDAGKRDQETQHGNGGDGVQKIDYAQRGLGRPLKLADQYANQSAEKHGDENGQ